MAMKMNQNDVQMPQKEEGEKEEDRSMSRSDRYVKIIYMFQANKHSNTECAVWVGMLTSQLSLARQS